MCELSKLKLTQTFYCFSLAINDDENHKTLILMDINDV